jgi:hypothetical protein
LKKPKIKYTCLHQQFYINQIVKLKFAYEKCQYEEICNLLPVRRDEAVLLGREWIKKSIRENKLSKISKPKEESKSGLEELKEKPICGAV